jgi:hypothetical protein
MISEHVVRTLSDERAKRVRRMGLADYIRLSSCSLTLVGARHQYTCTDAFMFFLTQNQERLFFCNRKKAH